MQNARLLGRLRVEWKGHNLHFVRSHKLEITETEGQ